MALEAPLDPAFSAILQRFDWPLPTEETISVMPTG
jgi:hypothetical protein